MEVLIVAVAGLLAVAGAATLAPRLRIAAPLLLVVLGIGVSFLPFVPAVEVDPEWILAGVLPPLLYSSSVAMPTMNFRREFTAIRSLAVALVVLSSVVLGCFFSWVVPGLDLWWGIALGAIVSPTDAVATSIVKGVGVSGRIASVLEGESLLNDATALVLLRSAIAGTAAAVSLRHVAFDFAYAVAVALALGVVVGWVNLRVRARVTDATVNTIISFTVPFLASIPAELLGASGLVAAVVAGLVTGYGAPRLLPPRHRRSDTENWRTVELVLEGTIFLMMGLELFAIVSEVQDEHQGVGTAVTVATGALVLVLVVRAAFLTPLLLGLGRRARRGRDLKPKLAEMQERMEREEQDFVQQRAQRPGRPSAPSPAPSPERTERFATRVRRKVADIDYFLAAPLGWRDGAVLVWAGMRGAVTVAAAQTLPADAPNRSLLVLIAFTVAVTSLLVQGGTLGAFVARIRPAVPDAHLIDEERSRVRTLLVEIAADDPAAAATGPPPGLDDGADTRPSVHDAIRIISRQREALLDARDDGVFTADVLEETLAGLDATQISLELRA